jgi:rhamnosyltransferase
MNFQRVDLQNNDNIMPPKINVSILIRAKNEDKYIGQTLSVLFSQTYKNFEVLIVDSGSTDKTLEIARRYPVRIYEIKPEDFRWGYALNYGFEKARGEYVVCLSAHALPLSDEWLETLVANFNDDKVAAVTSNMLPMPDCNPFDRRGLLKRYSVEKRELSEGPPFLFSNSCSAIRRSAWDRVHFDESLLAIEEEDWARKIRKIGYKIIYEPEAKVYHSHNESLQRIYKRHYELSHAFIVQRMQTFSMSAIIFDFIIGSAYDMSYVLIKRDSLKWFFLAPLRRLVINYAKFKASRAVNKNTKAKAVI